MSFIRCSICVIFLEHATVRFHIWKRTVHLYYNLYYFFILTGPTPHKPDLHSQIAVHQHSHTNPIYTLRSPSTNTATQTRPTTSTTTHGLITTPRHTAELVVPSTTSSEPFTIGFLLIGLQWWVLLLGLFDLGCGFVWFGCVFCRADLSSCVCFFFLIEVALVDVSLCRWWLSMLLL